MPNAITTEGTENHRGILDSATKEEQLRAHYQTLFQAWGRQHWWPARTRFEVIAGAYLTQNTSWTNVERALAALRRARVLSLRGIRQLRLPELERLIRPAGYFRQKARSLKTFVRFVEECHGGSLARMFRQPTETLRRQLLALNGVGPETADSILLYAGQHPVFVVDAYTRRVLDRHGILPAAARYEEIRALFERSLGDVIWNESISDSVPAGKSGGAWHAPSRLSTAKRSSRAQVYNEMHGLIVGVGKNYCFKSAPQCDGCPLQKFLPVRQ